MNEYECFQPHAPLAGRANVYSTFFEKESNPSNFLEEGTIFHPYKRKQIIFYEGRPALGVYCIRSGKIKIYKTGSNGKPHILFIANPGDYLGVESVFAGEDFNSTSEMLEDGLVAFIHRQRFLELVRKFPHFSLGLADKLAKRIRNCDEERVSMADGSVRERMARTLVLLARSYGIATKEGTLINLILTREDLANMVGTALGTVLRLLKEFKEENSIRLDKKRILIQDQRGLEELAHLL